MSKIKLEVGKNYRNQKGEEVEIVKKANRGEYPFLGSNGEWYTENGKFDVDIAQPELDLIAEVPETCHAFITPDEAKKVTATRYTFAIPDGMTKLTVEQVSNRIIVEMVPEDKDPEPVDVKFKEGDIVFEDGRIMIVKKYPNLYHALIHGSPDRLHVNGSYGIPFTSEAFRLATPEEAQLLWDALKKAGKRWNPELMQMEEVPKPGDVYINDFGSVYILKSHSYNGRSYECFAWLGENGTLLTGGRCAPGRPATAEEARLLFDALKKEGKRWNAETMQVEDMPESERIREWVEANVEYGCYTQDDIAEVIESYLKHKEGKE